MRYNGLSVVLTLLLSVIKGGEGRVVEPQSPDRTGFQVLRLQASDSDLVDTALRLADEYELNEWAELNRPDGYVDVMVNLEKKERFTRAIEDAGIVSSVMIEDVEERIKRHVTMKKRSANDNYDYDSFNVFEDIEKELKKINNTYSDIARLDIIGETFEKRNMYVLRVSKDIGPAPTKPIILIDAGIHAREWVSISTIMYIINQVVRNPSDDLYIKAFLDSYEFVFMPVLNPDGYAYTQVDRLWRKNRVYNDKSSCRGVDLNRNWDYKWGGLGTSGRPCQIDYRGPAAFSELETKAVQKWVEAYKSKILLYINFHAYGQLWMTPYGYSTDTPSNEVEMLKYSKIAVKAIKKSRGTEYRYGPVYTTIYPASSISVDWVRGAEDVPLAYTVELPDKGDHGFLTPPSEIPLIGKETWEGIRALLITLADDKGLLKTAEIIIV
ncbi:carboxypeptidase B-like [Bolinopsis microptera]|uniref:carboxypeptidase B-like n=1 Tax=Bolinopsis microptera TaxID=2820187 RepID=UPI003079BA15